ncbi:MAG TPA: UbiA family prenyltransferase [Planctomycetota bacterium]|jgi:4-hydroxybenzoate polyprenyltransferase|nr:UbiA family prenyltransferase [Planctomycetota bacterium]
MRAWGRLLRLSLAPTAAADIVAGAVAGANGWPWRGDSAFAIALLVVASLAVYHGGMTLNDWADRGENRVSRPDRPIPSGAVAPRAALLVALALLILGPALAFRVSPTSGAILAGVSAVACAYDLGLRGAWIGPLLLATCRAGNLSAGIAFGAGSEPTVIALIPALVYGTYVFAVSTLGRLEDAPADVLRGSRPALHLFAAAAILAASPAAAGVSGRSLAAFVLSVWGAFGLVVLARRTTTWSSGEVTRATGAGLRRLLVFTAALALAAGGPAGPFVAAGILAGYPISYALRGVFPPS